MKNYKEVETTKKKLQEVICDRPGCGKKITGQELKYGHYGSITITGGFASFWPGDLTKAEIDLCEYCLKDMFGDFARLSRHDPLRQKQEL